MGEEKVAPQAIVEENWAQGPECYSIKNLEVMGGACEPVTQSCCHSHCSGVMGAFLESGPDHMEGTRGDNPRPGLSTEQAWEA